MKVSIGADHGGFELKEYLVENLKNEYELKDNGCFSKDSVDYPLYAKMVAEDIQNKVSEYGILICTNGIGITIAANKFKGIRCALCVNEEMAEHAKLHNDANIVSLGKVNQSKEEALKIVKKFLETAFSNEERHLRRVNEIISFEGEMKC